MISIEYINDFLEGEPGPNFYWRGTPDDFLQLVADLHCLGVNNGAELSLNTFDYIRAADNLKIILRSSENGRNLCSKNESGVVMNLDKNLWCMVLDKLLSVSFEKSHNYIDFDELDLTESANVIISSEAQ
jgi:hypothetical protein